jgi:hypothetical protein
MLRALKSMALLALSGLVLASAGCLAAAVVAGAAVGYGAVKYSENDAYEDFHAPLDDVWRATLASLRENGYPVSLDAAHGPTEGSLHVGDADVRVERWEPDRTRVHVRIGTFVDEDHRRRAGNILNGISNRVR